MQTKHDAGCIREITVRGDERSLFQPKMDLIRGVGQGIDFKIQIGQIPVMFKHKLLVRVEPVAKGHAPERVGAMVKHPYPYRVIV